MNRHLITVVLLLIALSLYILGAAGAGTVALCAGAAFEAWFWARVLVHRNRKLASDD